MGRQQAHAVVNRVSPVKTVDRLVSILDVFRPERPAWSLAELSFHLGLPRSTLHRFLVGLEAHGILRRERGDARWRLGYRLFVWGSLVAETMSLRHLALPVMGDLADATGETVILTVYEAQEVICIEKVETRQPVRLALETGSRQLPHAGASSKILMAHQPEQEIHAIMRAKGLPRLCTNTITDPDRIRIELEKIREQGYAQSYEETDPGAWGVATAIRGRNGEVIAGIGVAGPTSRFDEGSAKQYICECQEAARRISALLSTGVDLLTHQSPLSAPAVDR
jgi:DNA-binding IclR family transcriptional regulator